MPSNAIVREQDSADEAFARPYVKAYSGGHPGEHIESALRLAVATIDLAVDIPRVLREQIRAQLLELHSPEFVEPWR
jgi:hypothetical protein